MSGFSFGDSNEYRVSTVTAEEGERVRMKSPRFNAGAEVTRIGPIEAVLGVSEEDGPDPLMVTRKDALLGDVGEAWVVEGGDLDHIRMFAPSRVWVDAYKKSPTAILSNSETRAPV
jgi:hypothetical protein